VVSDPAPGAIGGLQPTRGREVLPIQPIHVQSEIAIPYPVDATLHALFFDRAARTRTQSPSSMSRAN
jgi:hypothetical protein